MVELCMPTANIVNDYGYRQLLSCGFSHYYGLIWSSQLGQGLCFEIALGAQLAVRLSSYFGYRSPPIQLPDWSRARLRHPARNVLVRGLTRSFLLRTPFSDPCATILASITAVQVSHQERRLLGSSVSLSDAAKSSQFGTVAALTIDSSFLLVVVDAFDGYITCLTGICSKSVWTTTAPSKFAIVFLVVLAMWKVSWFRHTLI